MIDGYLLGDEGRRAYLQFLAEEPGGAVIKDKQYRYYVPGIPTEDGGEFPLNLLGSHMFSEKF